jgi:hypothetical protein
MMKSLLALTVLLTVPAAAPSAGTRVPDLAELQTMTARLSPVEIEVDTSALTPGDQKALARLVEASRVLNDVFLQQMWKGNQALFGKLRTDDTPLGRARLHYFWLNKGPWSEIDGFTAFLPGVPPEIPAGANFYPEDMKKSEFEAWAGKLSKEQRQEALGFFTVIRRGTGGALRIVPYSREYRPDLEKMAALLRDAARDTDNASLKKFLELRAKAFLSNDYYESDLAWMDLDAPIDVTIGPYETYNDRLFGYKAAFEAHVGVRDDEETKKVAMFSAHLQEIENHLPEDPKYRNPKLGALAPIRVVNDVFGAGDGDHGIKTVAFNLPNDDRVVQQKGAKRVMLKNLNEAKFRKILVPIAHRLLPEKDWKDVRFEPFFTWILAHELSHGIGPHVIEVAGRRTSPRLEIKELYGPLEEAKADITGLFALQHLMDAGILPGGPRAERQLYTTYLASAFRTLHFGLQDAHALGQAVQFNFLSDEGAIVHNPDGTFSIDFSKIKGAVRDLDHEFLTIEARGDYAAARKMLDTLGVLRPAATAALERLHDVPTDIAPVYATADRIAPRRGIRLDAAP